MLSGEEAIGDAFMDVSFEPVQLHDLCPGEHVLEPIPVAHGDQIERRRTKPAETVAVQVVEMAMGDEDYPHRRKLLRRQGEGSETAEEKSDVFEDGIRHDIHSLEADPKGPVPEIREGVAPFQDFLYIRLEDLKGRAGLFLFPERVGGKPPFQEPQEPPRVLLGEPGIYETGIFMVGLCPGEGLEVFRLGAGGLPN
jgi:hypothetical protein